MTFDVIPWRLSSTRQQKKILTGVFTLILNGWRHDHQMCHVNPACASSALITLDNYFMAIWRVQKSIGPRCRGRTNVQYCNRKNYWPVFASILNGWRHDHGIVCNDFMPLWLTVKTISPSLLWTTWWTIARGRMFYYPTHILKKLLLGNSRDREIVQNMSPGDSYLRADFFHRWNA